MPTSGISCGSFSSSSLEKTAHERNEHGSPSIFMILCLNAGAQALNYNQMNIFRKLGTRYMSLRRTVAVGTGCKAQAPMHRSLARKFVSERYCNWRRLPAKGETNG